MSIKFEALLKPIQVGPLTAFNRMVTALMKSMSHMRYYYVIASILNPTYSLSMSV